MNILSPQASQWGPWRRRVAKKLADIAIADADSSKQAVTLTTMQSGKIRVRAPAAEADRLFEALRHR